jgi:uncharacterized protein (TIGR02246 family)
VVDPATPHRPVLRSLMALTAGAILVAAVFAPRSHGAAQDRDESEIRAVQARQAEAWNRHDAAAYADLFEADGEAVNVVGWWWKGRAEIEGKLTAAFAYVFRESTLTVTEVDVRFLTPEIAVAHVRWTMTGARTPPPIPEPRAGIQTQVLRKSGGRWRISAFQNTNAVPEMPFPPDDPASRPAPSPSR